jgi:hypothetical protein
VRPSSGAATGFIQATKHFPTACLTRIAAAGTAALRQHRNSTSEFGLKVCEPCLIIEWLSSLQKEHKLSSTNQQKFPKSVIDGLATTDIFIRSLVKRAQS